MNMKTVVRTVALTFMVVASAIHALAQSSTARLTGSAIDESGAVVPRVQISVIDVERRIERRSATNDEGLFSVLSLPPGHYSLTAERAGFSTVQIPDVVLNV